MPAYATPQDFIDRYDARQIAQLLSDTGVPVCTPAQIADGTCATVVLPSNVKLSALIKDASNRILMKCRVANRYLQSDLDKIYGDSDRKESLVRLVCDLAYGYLVSRRGLAIQEVYEQAPMFRDAQDMLAMLERGLAVLDDSPPDGTDAPSAGSNVELVPNMSTNNSRMAACIWTNQASRIFPVPDCCQ